jgi:hypothetical protein
LYTSSGILAETTVNLPMDNFPSELTLSILKLKAFNLLL